MEIKIKDKEVENPILRFLVLISCIAGGILIVICGFIFVLLVIVLIPIWLPIHFILKMFGRRGFIRYENGVKISLTHKAFYKE